MQTTYISYAKRTPIGKLSGGLAQVPAPKLGAILVEDALKTMKSKDIVDEIIMGNVLSAGVGQAPARQAAIYGGLPNSVRALTINRVCGSGLKSVMLADQAIRLGEANIVFAGGQENMTAAPHLLANSRSGTKFGAITMQDHMQFDGLWDPYNDMAMGNCGEICAEKYDFTREAQDAFSLESYKRAQKAWEEGAFVDEVVPVEVMSRRKTIRVEKDEEPFAADLERLAALRPAFKKDGTITAGNASSINDGAALLVVGNKEALEAQNQKPIAKIIAQSSFAHAPEMFTTAPVQCMKDVLDKAGLTVNDIDLFEINEAFAVVTMAAIHDLKLDSEKVNVHGGAVSIGHPIGASGARILVTLLNAMKRKNAKRGLAAICIGGGEASAIIVEAV